MTSGSINGYSPHLKQCRQTGSAGVEACALVSSQTALSPSAGLLFDNQRGASVAVRGPPPPPTAAGELLRLGRITQRLFPDGVVRCPAPSSSGASQECPVRRRCSSSSLRKVPRPPLSVRLLRYHRSHLQRPRPVVHSGRREPRISRQSGSLAVFTWHPHQEEPSWPCTVAAPSFLVNLGWNYPFHTSARTPGRHSAHPAGAPSTARSPIPMALWCSNQAVRQGRSEPGGGISRVQQAKTNSHPPAVSPPPGQGPQPLPNSWLSW